MACYVKFDTDRKINLIKEIRNKFYIGLKEAKDAVEQGLNTDEYGMRLCREAVNKVSDASMQIYDSQEGVQTIIPARPTPSPLSDPTTPALGSFDILIQQVIAEKVQEAIAPLLAELNACKQAVAALTQRVKPLERAITGDVDDLDLDD